MLETLWVLPSGCHETVITNIKILGHGSIEKIEHAPIEGEKENLLNFFKANNCTQVFKKQILLSSCKQFQGTLMSIIFVID